MHTKTPILDVSFDIVPTELVAFLDPFMMALCKEPDNHLLHPAVVYKNVNHYRKGPPGTLVHPVNISEHSTYKFQVHIFPNGKLKHLSYVTDSRVGVLLVAAVHIDERLRDGTVNFIQQWFYSMKDKTKRTEWIIAARTQPLDKILDTIASNMSNKGGRKRKQLGDDTITRKKKQVVIDQVIIDKDDFYEKILDEIVVEPLDDSFMFDNTVQEAPRVIQNRPLTLTISASPNRLKGLIL
jgi:hypothetical protein